MDDLATGPTGAREGHTTEQAEALVLRLIADHADSLLRVARRHSICADDAQDAYQRGLEILMRHAWRLDPERAVGWLHTVVRREAVALNRSRRRYLGAAEVDFDRFEASTSRSPEEAVLGFERVERSAAALKQLKPQELRALWLKALGHSYEEICASTGWTYTKVNRCLAEGRRSFLERYAGIEAGDECRRLAPGLSALVDGESDAESVLELRAHLRHCVACRSAMRELRGSTGSLAAVFPIGGLAMADVADPASHFFVRLYEAVVVGFNERAANSLLRAQVIVEAVTTTKVATVAASAVAMTGGGLAVGQAVHPRVGGASERSPASIARASALSPEKSAAVRRDANAAVRSGRPRPRRSPDRAEPPTPSAGRSDAVVASAQGTPRPRSTATGTTTPAVGDSRPAGAAQPTTASASAASEFTFEG